VKTENRETANVNPPNLERENVEAQNPEAADPDLANGNPPNPEQENVEAQNPDLANTENKKSGFPVLPFAITGGAILVAGTVTTVVLAKRKKGKGRNLDPAKLGNSNANPANLE